MIRTLLPRALAAPLLSLALGASAAPVYLIDATTDGLAPDPSFVNVGFSLTYEDFNYDMLFSLDELLAFTGVFDGGGNYFDTLIGVPTLPGTSGNGAVWSFHDSNGALADFSAAAGAYTPFTTGALPGSVPEPASWALAGLALLGAAAARRRRC